MSVNFRAVRWPYLKKKITQVSPVAAIIIIRKIRMINTFCQWPDNTLFAREMFLS